MSRQFKEPYELNKLPDPALWVDQYADHLYSYAIARVNDEELAKDLVQETFLAALEKRDRFEGRSSASTWLTAILKNKIIDIYRKRSAKWLRPTEELEKTEETGDFFETGSGHWNAAHQPSLMGFEDTDLINNKEFGQILHRCMHKLPALWLAVFTMKHMEDSSTAIICTELKVSASNFWVIIHRAKLNLRACLQKNWL